MDAATIERLLKDFGFPIVATSALGWSIWATLRWVAGNLIIPVRDRSFSFLDRVEGNVDKMSDNLEKQTTALKDLNDKQSAIKDDIGRIAETCQMRCIHEGRFERNGDGRS
jgi:hypothetical protein